MQTVTQYQITEWDSNGYIENPQSIITVIEEMYKIQRKVGTSPIIIHCRYDEVKIIKYERIWAIFLIVYIRNIVDHIILSNLTQICLLVQTLV